MLCLTSKALSFESKHITFLIYVKKVYEMKSMLLAAILYFIANMTLAQSIKLLMFEQDGCYWCEIWDDEISEIYPKTLEGHVAPLHRINIHSKQSNEIILNVGGKTQSIYDFAKKFNPKVKKILAPKSAKLPLNQSMDIKKLKKISKS